MQLGFVSAILAEYDLEKTLATAQRIGFDCVEIMCWPPGKAERRYAGVTHIDVTDLNEQAIEQINQLCDEYGLYVVDEANIETHGFEMQAERPFTRYSFTQTCLLFS